MNTEEFLKNASSRSKNIGNNRYQDEIKNLNDKIEELSKSMNGKDEELKLFKRNFTDMQIQFQEKNINIMESTNKLTEAEVEIKELNNKIMNLNNMNLMLISNLEKDKQKIQNEKDEFINNLNIVSSDKNDLQSRYDDIKLKYKETLSELHSKINNLEELNVKYTNIFREHNLLIELNNTKLTELDSLHKELLSENNHINSLKVMLIENEFLLKQKENQLKDIHSRMENNLFNYNITLKELKNSNKNDNNQVILLDTTNEVIEVTTNEITTATEVIEVTTNEVPILVTRGLKVSRR